MLSLGCRPRCAGSSRPRIAAENLIGTLRHVSRRVDSSRAGDMRQRWLGLGLLRAAERFRRIKAHDDLGTLGTALGARAVPGARQREPSAQGPLEQTKATMGSGSIFEGGALCRYPSECSNKGYDVLPVRHSAKFNTQRDNPFDSAGPRSDGASPCPTNCAREQAREATLSGKLPARQPDRTWGGLGVGIECVILRAVRDEAADGDRDPVLTRRRYFRIGQVRPPRALLRSLGV